MFLRSRATANIANGANVSEYREGLSPMEIFLAEI